MSFTSRKTVKLQRYQEFQQQQNLMTARMVIEKVSDYFIMCSECQDWFQFVALLDSGLRLYKNVRLTKLRKSLLFRNQGNI